MKCSIRRAPAYERIKKTIGMDHHGLHHEKSSESDGCDMIMVIVDRLIKFTYMIPATEKINAEQMANI